MYNFHFQFKDSFLLSKKEIGEGKDSNQPVIFIVPCREAVYRVAV